MLLLDQRKILMPPNTCTVAHLLATGATVAADHTPCSTGSSAAGAHPLPTSCCCCTVLTMAVLQALVAARKAFKCIRPLSLVYAVSQQVRCSENLPEGEGHPLALATVLAAARHMVLQSLLTAPASEVATSLRRRTRPSCFYLRPRVTPTGKSCAAEILTSGRSRHTWNRTLYHPARDAWSRKERPMDIRVQLQQQRRPGCEPPCHCPQDHASCHACRCRSTEH